jgi:hypothetical protein
MGGSYQKCDCIRLYRKSINNIKLEKLKIKNKK